ncbi:MAG: orotate phosphoribosyltransferase [Syntrophaceae bacterium]|nr:orotate phosphoribosyltransferase [Syntrophaceae bacterium]
MTKGELGKRVFELSNIRGEFLLRSGVVSNEYFDKYLFESPPDVLKAIVDFMAEFVPEKTDALAGLEMGGIPLATMLSQVTGIPALFVRKKAKDYGTCKLAEGGDVEKRRLVVVEDVVTSGGQIVKSVAELRQMGAVISDVLCVIDREAGGKEHLADEKLTLHPLFTMSELKKISAM